METKPVLISFKLKIAISALLVLAVIAAALPQPVAAASCMTYYTVKAGDKTGKISRNFDVKWIEIAKANNLERPYELQVGQRLCIPFKYSVSLKGNINVRSVNNLIQITAAGFPNKGSYTVKVRDVTLSAGDWYKLGKLSIKKNTSSKGDYILPKALKGAIYLEVCIKNGTTDHVVCKTVAHRYK